ncbi:unnamed protein product [Blepharisma stoltei]|uniref:Uncharacterized protein n=1 Tax=Blepharisma stoltei TaxID=1481888 RepID=A0AAU9J8M7_9CILI|nr:unnamed protein product [Blepharisma stoltei]
MVKRSNDSEDPSKPRKKPKQFIDLINPLSHKIPKKEEDSENEQEIINVDDNPFSESKTNESESSSDYKVFSASWQSNFCNRKLTLRDRPLHKCQGLSYALECAFITAAIGMNKVVPENFFKIRRKYTIEKVMAKVGIKAKQLFLEDYEREMGKKGKLNLIVHADDCLSSRKKNWCYAVAERGRAIFYNCWQIEPCFGDSAIIGQKIEFQNNGENFRYVISALWMLENEAPR